MSLPPAAQAPSDATTVVKRANEAEASVEKNDPKLVAAARELRDRWLEEVNSPGGRFALGGLDGKYDVTRTVGRGASRGGAVLLPAA